MYTIYALRDPRDLQIHYIGMTENHPVWRLVQHCQSRDDENRAKAEWIAGLQVLGARPDVVVLEYVPDRDMALATELFWIKQGLRSGWPLLNQEIRTRHNPAKRRVTSPAIAKPKAVSTIDSEWITWAREYVKEHPSLLNVPPSGVRDMARAMSLHKTGSEDRVTNYQGLASNLCKKLRTDITHGGA